MPDLQFSADAIKDDNYYVLVQALCDNVCAGIPGASVAEPVVYEAYETGKYDETYVDEYMFKVAFNGQQLSLKYMFEMGGAFGEELSDVVYYSVESCSLKGVIEVFSSSVLKHRQWTLEGELAAVKAAAGRIVSALVERDLLKK